jgi:DNA-binding GntR family transcriptional regulator
MFFDHKIIVINLCDACGYRMRGKLKSHQNKRISNPIKNYEDINLIRFNLGNKPRDLLLFDLATQTGIGLQKLLRLKVKNLTGIKEGEKVSIDTDKDKKYSFTINKAIFDAFYDYLEKVKPKPDDYLFKSKKGQRPLNLSSASKMIKGWFETANIQNCYGAISLRKTWEITYNKSRVDQDTTTVKPASIFKPIEIITTQKKIFQELLKAIIAHKVPPGTKLTTAEIAKTFGVSQAPVRAALNWLEAKGFIISQKKSGSVVRELTAKELFDIVQIRVILETGAARLACEVCTEETFYIIESIIKRFKNASTYEERDQINRLFHITVPRDINNPMLIDMISDLYDRFAPYAALTFTELGYIPDHNLEQVDPEYYVKILEGMRRKDVDKVTKFLELMILRGTAITEEIIKKNRSIDSNK